MDEALKEDEDGFLTICSIVKTAANSTCRLGEPRCRGMS